MFLGSIISVVGGASAIMEEDVAFNSSIKDLPEDIKNKLIKSRKKEQEKRLKQLQLEKSKKKDNVPSYGVIGFLFGFLLGSN